jgi:peptide-methionine (S)-S-oxide reductase
VCGGDGHTEAILIEYDPTVVDFESLLGEFFRMHDPLKKQQTQYSSAIFACDENQMEIAKRECYQLGPHCTTFVEPLTSWTDAEKKHQKYLEKRAILKRRRKKNNFAR